MLASDSALKKRKSYGLFKAFIPVVVKQTIPVAIPVLRKSKRLVIFLIIFSILLGIVPTLKTDLESGIIDQANNILTVGSRLGPADIFNVRLGDFYQPTSDNADPIEILIYHTFRGITFGSALLIYLVIIIVAVVLTFWSNVFQQKITSRIFTVLRAQALHKGLLTDPSNLPSLSNIAGQYAMGIHQGADNISGTYGYLLEAGQYIFSLITTLYLVATRSIVLALSCLLVVGFQVAISVIRSHKLEKRRNDLDEKRNELVGRTDDILDKREIILAYEQEDNYTKKLTGLSQAYATVGQDLGIQEQKYNNLLDLVTDLGRLIIIILSLVVIILFSKESISSIGDVYFIIAIYTRILLQAQNVLGRYDDIKRSEATSRTFLELLQEQERIIVSEPSSLSTSAPTGPLSEDLSIRFVNVSFKYKKEGSKDGRDEDHYESEEDDWVLRNCTFEAPGNAVTLIVGRSGCGKTTIARIILGFWPVSEGKVYVDGKRLDAWDLAALRGKMSYVAQGDHIVEDSVRDNLSWAYTAHPISDDRMLEALKEVGIIRDVQDHLILDRPAKNLSGGQQQRLSIARMMLDESPVVILDEPFTGVDVFTLHELLPVFNKALKRPNRTVLMFSHNLILTNYADHIVVIGEDRGVVEEGKPNRLLEKQAGIFAELHRMARQDLKVKS